VISDCWVSMGDEKESRRRHNLLARYQVNRELMRRAAPDAIFMHCLPAHRGEEVTDDVMDGPHRWCSTRRRTACTRRKASSPGAWERWTNERKRPAKSPTSATTTSSCLMRLRV